MNIHAQLRAVRLVLVAGVVLRAAAWGIVAAVTLVIGGAVADLVAPLSPALRSVLVGVAVASGVVVALALTWRDRAPLSLRRVALWIEEHFPALEYSLITAVELKDDKRIGTHGANGWSSTALRRASRALGTPLAAVIVGVVVTLLLPTGAVARMRSPHAGDSLERASIGKRTNRLTPLVAEVVPPQYSGEKTVAIDEPNDIRALAGSVVTLRGRGDGAGVVARVGTDTIVAATRGDRWSITLHLASRPAAVRLGDGAYERIIAVEPIADAPPSVTLAAPAHDSVLRVARGRIPLSADMTDDFGIANASFEYIVSSGEGETFKFRSGTLGAVQPNSRRASITSSLLLDSLSLKPGDIVHLRAVARDANTITGPGVGVSDTRAIRIARADEYDSVAVDAAPPSDADKSVISERMLIVLAEALQAKRPTLKRDALVGESHSIAADQKKLRRSVGEIVFTRLGGDPNGEEHSDEDSPQRAKTMQELLARADSATNRSSDPIDFAGGESPVVAVNKPLLEAYNAMWDASTELEIGEPGRALPHMRRALAAIQKARQAERLYLRGTPPRVVIDISKARLKGKDKGSASTRRALTSADSVAHARADRFSRILELASRDASSAVDSLLLLRVDALGEEPTFAAALSDAISAMRANKSDEATAALGRARRSLSGAPIARDSLARWGIIP
ncbi:MAG TPA: hypothetical protein VK636_04250 [Gemmatimonadaceae bacterium]|nr:hypothetical protein [Gemmatimonadaceae bacterium]